MFQYRQGQPPKQAHKAIPEGRIEEEQGHKGFFGPVSHLIKKNPSTRWTKIDGPLRPHMYDLVKLEKQPGRRRLFFNSDVAISMQWVMPVAPSELIGERNADGDLIFFCHQGSGEIFSEYGLLKYRKGHYIVIPKCLTHTIAAEEPSNFLVIENRSSHFEQPERGIVGRHAIYDQGALTPPDLETMTKRLNEMKAPLREIQIKRLDEITRFEYDACIYDTEAWKGDLFPLTLHMDDMMPLMSHRAHLPPSAHTTFVGREFVICTFLPRPLERDRDALKVPFYHQNMDYDEILFYHDGDFFSRDNLHPGMLSLHPAGFPHGPHPKAVKSIGDKTETKEYAVMVDVRKPLQMDPLLESAEVKDYWKSWQSKP